LPTGVSLIGIIINDNDEHPPKQDLTVEVTLLGINRDNSSEYFQKQD
jgi:hypothetical protein